MKGRHNLTIFLVNFSTNFRRNSTRKIVRWFEELINLNHLAIFITEFNQKLVEKLSEKFSHLSRTHRCSVGISPYFKARLNILSLSHFREPYGAASVAPMWFCYVLKYRHFTSKLLNNFTGQRLDQKIQEKRNGKRNRDTFAIVLFLFRSVMPVPRKLDQTIIFLSLSHLWVSRRYSVGN